MKTSILFALLTLALFHQNDGSKVSSNPIYEILTRGDSRTCYLCDGDCLLPERVNCPGTSRCYSKTVKASNDQIVGHKGCVEDNYDTICDGSIREDTSCYVCVGNLCNKEELPKAEVAEALGTATCYTCSGECATPTATHNCQEVLNTDDRTVTAACFSFVITQGDSVETYKGCLEDDPDIQMTCTAASLFMPEISCNICRTDLCNGNPEDEEIFPEECYHCDSSCEVGEARNCKEVLGQSALAKCVALEYLNDQSQVIVERKCAVVDSALQSQCDLINQLGGNCTICSTNLCNGHQQGPVVASVSQCYACNGTCDSATVEDCREALGDVPAICLAVDHGNDYLEKGCVPAGAMADTICLAVTAIGGTCTTCDTDLCNAGTKGAYFTIMLLVVTMFASRYV